MINNYWTKFIHNYVDKYLSHIEEMHVLGKGVKYELQLSIFIILLYETPMTLNHTILYFVL